MRCPRAALQMTRIDNLSTIDYATTVLSEPLTPEAAKTLARSIVANEGTVFSGHALEEMAADNLTTQDALNTIRAGAYQPAELQNGSWRHRAQTQRMTFVVTFRSETELVVVTGWRHRR
jgi:hypothetical protein